MIGIDCNEYNVTLNDGDNSYSWDYADQVEYKNVPRLRDRIEIIQRKQSIKVAPARGTAPSKQWKQLNQRKNKVHEKITNATNHMIRRFARETRDMGDVFVMENRLSDMIENAAGTVEEPGENVGFQTDRNRNMLQSKHGTLKRMLAEYCDNVFEIEKAGGNTFDGMLYPEAGNFRSCTAPARNGGM